MKVGSLIRFRNTGVLGIVIKRSCTPPPYCLERWRVIGMKNLKWYELAGDNPYIEVISESR